MAAAACGGGTDPAPRHEDHEGGHGVTVMGIGGGG